MEFTEALLARIVGIVSDVFSVIAESPIKFLVILAIVFGLAFAAEKMDAAAREVDEMIREEEAK